MTLNRAMISLCDAEGKSKGEAFYVQFNPNQIHIQDDVGQMPEKHSLPQGADARNDAVHRTPARHSKSIRDAQKKKHGGLRFSTKLFFNTYYGANDYSDVRTLLGEFYKFTNNGKAGSNAQIKYISFSWGSLQIYGRLSSLGATYTMFSPDGHPVRAELDIEITGDYTRKTELGSKNAALVLLPTEYMNFAAALAAYGTLDALKAACRAANIANIRVGV